MFIQTVHNIIRHDLTKNNADISKVFMNYGKDSLQNLQRIRIMNTVPEMLSGSAEGTATKRIGE